MEEEKKNIGNVENKTVGENNEVVKAQDISVVSSNQDIPKVEVNDNQPVVSDAPHEEVVKEEKKVVSPMEAPEVHVDVPKEVESSQSESNIISETVINTDVNTSEAVENNTEVSSQGIIEEVSINVEGDSLNNIEASENSIFNPNKIKEEEEKAKGMKEGAEKTQPKGFPYFMLIIFVLVIVASFFIDDISSFVQSFLEKNDTEDVVENNEETEEDTTLTLTLDQIKTALDSSSNIALFESNNNITIDISIVNDHLIFETSDYINNTEENITLDYTFANDILTTSCTMSNTEFGKEITIILIKEIASLQGVTSSNLSTFIEDNLYTLTIDKGFNLTNSEDGNNTYMVATNIKLEVDSEESN